MSRHKNARPSLARRIWAVTCALIGAAIGGLLLQFLEDSTFLTALGIGGGGLLGYLFGRYVSLFDFLTVVGGS